MSKPILYRVFIAGRKKPVADLNLSVPLERGDIITLVSSEDSAQTKTQKIYHPGIYTIITGSYRYISSDYGERVVKIMAEESVYESLPRVERASDDLEMGDEWENQNPVVTQDPDFYSEGEN
jgi:hypothetical protein